MSIDITFLIRIINPARIIFCVDSPSWRKSILIEENEGYKGNRIRTASINWDNVYDAIGKFTDIIRDNGMIVTKIDTAESDDLLALWNEELALNQRQHVIVVSGDEDLRQLVRCLHTGSDDGRYKYVFTTVFNPFMQ